MKNLRKKHFCNVLPIYQKIYFYFVCICNVIITLRHNNSDLKKYILEENVFWQKNFIGKSIFRLKNASFFSWFTHICMSTLKSSIYFGNFFAFSIKISEHCFIVYIKLLQFSSTCVWTQGHCIYLHTCTQFCFCSPLLLQL